MKIEMISNYVWAVSAWIDDKWSEVYVASSAKEAAEFAEQYYKSNYDWRRNTNGSLDSLRDIFLGDSYK